MNDTSDSQRPLAPEPGAARRPHRGWLSWRVMRRWLFAVACLATLIALLYAVEDWRGWRAWKQCRREAEAQGAVFDWNAFIPAAVPDDQNFFKAPKMAEWFVKENSTTAVSPEVSKVRAANAPFKVSPPQDTNRSPLVVAEVKIVPPDAPVSAGEADAVLVFGDPAAHEQVAKLLLKKVGPCAEAASGFGLAARPLEQLHAVNLVLRASPTPTTAELGDFFSAGLSHFYANRLRSNTFRILLTGPVYSAADYLARSQSAVPDCDLLRQALERPYARMDSDYQRPYARPIPNFVRLRTVAQMLAQRAQCYLLLGQSGAAWHELALVRDMCHMLEAKPGSDCPTLVETMIDGAIGGLYTRIIQEGLRLRVWQEPELVAMQQQLGRVNYLPLLRRSFETARASTCHTFETTPPAELKKLFGASYDKWDLWGKLKDPTFLLLTFAPRGWLYQNMCAGTPYEQKLIEALDVPNNQVLPAKLHGMEQWIIAFHTHTTPYNFLAVRALPNFVKATQVMARNQTLANEAFIACGLERYHLAHGQYPEKLEALVPQFAEKLPHDLIGGQPLKYHRTAEGGFVLYSVGWNEQDDGGVTGKTVAEGDWVWQ